LTTFEGTDLLEAQAELQADLVAQFADLTARLERLNTDIKAQFTTEATEICNAINRAVVDRKSVIDVVFALKIDWLKNLKVTTNAGVITGFDLTGTQTASDTERYRTLFDDFHYDIGHGKGTG